MKDELVLARARRGDPIAVESILREHAPRIRTLCRRLCRDDAEADDATQEALIAVVRGLPRFDGRSSFSTWVHRVATNAALDELRRRSRRPVPVDESARNDTASTDRQPDDLALGRELRGEIAAALERLPEEFRIAVVLRDVADLDYAEIARITDVPVGTVRSRIARGRGQLADMLDPAPRNDSSGASPGTSAPVATSEGQEP